MSGGGGKPFFRLTEEHSRRRMKLGNLARDLHEALLWRPSRGIMWKTSMAGVCRAYLDFTAKKTGKTLIRRALEELERAELVRVERDEDGVVQGVECIDLFVETAAAEPSAPKAEAASREEQNRPMGLREFLKSNPEYTEKSKLIQKIMAIGGAHG